MSAYATGSQESVITVAEDAWLRHGFNVVRGRAGFSYLDFLADFCFRGFGGG
jgi:hypothetical protein